MKLFSLFWILEFMVFSSAIYIDSSYSKDDLILGNANYFIEGSVRVKNLLISSCARIVFNDFRSKIIVLNGTVNIQGNVSCKVTVSEKNHVPFKFVLTPLLSRNK